MDRAENASALNWLLASPPCIRWQTMQDIACAPAESVAVERKRVGIDDEAARLLSLQSADGAWNGVAWNRGWNSTMHVLMLLRDMGIDPSSPQVRRATDLVRERVTWKGCGPTECDGNGFFDGEIEPCINGQVAAVGAYFGQNVDKPIDRLLAGQRSDGGWNCEAASNRSSFNTTICVLEALLAYEQATGHGGAISTARRRGEAYLLERRLFRRLSTGEAIERDRKGGAAWTRFAFPCWWHYDVLRGLDYLRSAGIAFDERMSDAIELLASKRDATGKWPLETLYPGEMPIDFHEREGQPSRWITLRALRVLKCFGRPTPATPTYSTSYPHSHPKPSSA